jgi:hypothetical protein
LFPGDHVEGQIIRADRQKCAYIVLPLPLFLDKYKRLYDTINPTTEKGEPRLSLHDRSVAESHNAPTGTDG